MEQLLAEAARQIGIHPETLRRQIKRGERPARRDTHGRYWVEIAGASAPHEAAEPSTHGVDDAYTPSRREFERLLGEVEFLRRQLEEAATERAEMRRLLAMHMPALPAATMPATASERPASGADTVEVMQKPSRPWWAFWRA